MEDVSVKIIRWTVVIVIIAMAGVVLALLLLVLNLLFIKFGFSEGVNGGIIAAVGAVIGGSLTLIGVKWTLRNQQVERFMETYPIKIRKIDSIYDLLSNEFLEVMFNYEGSRNYFNDLMTIASECDGNIYNELKQLHTNVITMLTKLKDKEYREKIPKEKITAQNILSSHLTDEAKRLRQELLININLERKKSLSFMNEYKQMIERKMKKNIMY